MPTPEESTPNYTMAAMKAQAEEIVRAWGAPGSQESEVMAAASVGRAGYALAHLVLHWLRQERRRIEEQPIRMVIDLAGVLPDHLLDVLRGSGARIEYDTTPLRPPADTSWVKLDGPDA